MGLKTLLIPLAAFCATVALLPFVGATWALAVFLCLAAASAVWCLRTFFDYYLDAWVVTTNGIIDIEWHGWFHRQSARVLYSDVQGASYEVKGVWQTVLNVGTISIEKISTGSAISMTHVKNPRRVEGAILQNMEEYLHKKNLKDAKTVQDILTTVVAREMQTKALQQRKANSK